MTADGRIPPRAMYRKASSALLPESALTGAAVRSALPTRSVTVRKVFSIVSILAVLAVVLQFYFAGVGHFSIPEEGLFGIHGNNGRIVLPVLFILSLITAAIARAGKGTIWLTVVAILLLAFQTVLFILTGAIFNVGPESAEVPLGASLMLGLHAVNGVAILVITGIVARRAVVLAWPPTPALLRPTLPLPLRLPPMYKESHPPSSELAIAHNMKIGYMLFFKKIFDKKNILISKDTNYT
jgi:hypothetical protein